MPSNRLADDMYSERQQRIREARSTQDAKKLEAHINYQMPTISLLQNKMGAGVARTNPSNS